MLSVLQMRPLGPGRARGSYRCPRRNKWGEKRCAVRSTRECRPTSSPLTRPRIRLRAAGSMRKSEAGPSPKELVVQDAGISGASRHERPRFLELMASIDGWDAL